MTNRRTPGKTQLLILESDDLIRGLLVRWLCEAGYAVTSDESQPGAIALVIADIPNPAQAEAVLKELGARHGVPVLPMSGRFRRYRGAPEGVARRLGVARVLPKPFSGEELLAAVEACLGGR